MPSAPRPPRSPPPASSARLVAWNTGNRADSLRGVLHINIAPVQAASRDAVIPAFERGHNREAADAELTGSVRPGVESGALRGDASGVQDAAAALALHDLHRGTRAEEWTPQVDGNHFVPGLDRQLIQRAAVNGAGVVHQNVEPLGKFQSAPEQRLHLRLAGD